MSPEPAWRPQRRLSASSASRRAPVVALGLAAIVLCTLLAGRVLLPDTLSSLPAWRTSALSDGQGQGHLYDYARPSEGKTIPLDGVVRTYDELVSAQLASGWDEDTDGPALRIYGLDESLEDYVGRLGRFASEYLPPSYHAQVFEVLRRMEHRAAPPLPAAGEAGGMRRVIFTTDADKHDLPPAFARWGETHTGWDVEVYGNAEMERAVREMTQGSKLWDAWNAMPSVIFKADTIRYLVLFLHGGLYTDSDTAPLQHALTWGHDPLDRTGPSVDALRTLLAAGFDGSSPTDDEYAFTNTQHPILDGSVSAVLSVENNVIGHGDRWRADVGDTDPGWEEQFESAAQICQWTMMSKPFHPIFLDTLSRIMPRMLELHDEHGGELEQYPGALNLTGPGPFSQAVYRYLAVMYGFNPRNTPNGDPTPSRIGDIILLPERSTFGGCDWDTNTISPDYTDQGIWVSCHEGQGRWRPDEEERTQPDKRCSGGDRGSTCIN